MTKTHLINIMLLTSEENLENFYKLLLTKKTITKGGFMKIIKKIRCGKNTYCDLYGEWKVLKNDK